MKTKFYPEVVEKCPQCGSDLLYQKDDKIDLYFYCTDEKCNFEFIVEGIDIEE